MGANTSFSSDRARHLLEVNLDKILQKIKATPNVDHLRGEHRTAARLTGIPAAACLGHMRLTI